MTLSVLEPDFIILLVEDSPTDVEIVQRLFRKASLAERLRVARDGQLAMEFLFPSAAPEEGTPRLGLVLLDLHLPRASGWEIHEAIRRSAALNTTPVAVMTSTERDMTRVHSLRSQYTIAVEKPLTLGRLQEILRWCASAAEAKGEPDGGAVSPAAEGR